ncbi:hypothetical protein EHI8A_055020 [Entamoeba histolytica HM-1:IMSS-B]|uniref:Rhodanese domain-containing protein n=6 Tax=Entamoeba histolytica TaxID=5759 RepID=B1N2W0_ENTH1|nr:hypothetical protein EHI_013120 [Entamoeba histolytica HM-1:IMSS]EMD47591.1 Hypothetical protein EHI5A_088650 [Entamoeba histolytica KU27]EMH76680.1 hypothetical protein EHI8A_055020 [Entamoeba histolytica HM-1:IMSS-B]EMS13238.1 hypothetical protein KM1_105480 [Entamoeba histolytica HM-3:IMSS]ENY62683.1 hypothetical protein EHI7A_055000 [Entamoeba histolytica HM-1:IMSS-A]GAT93349.1 hypothetical protein CL6EHI_013120 [Entamoeba histolytica]|eukprot:XP_001913526.1 hypothetical protein EHI_013120 [Entamoeba histolytica HM-1:IMSS]
MDIEVDYINDEQLIQLMKDEKIKLQIFDVRSSDVGTCVIHGAINYRVTELMKKIPQILEKYHNYNYIVVHCMRSQQRGPKCARALKEAFITSKYFSTSNVSIVILAGGFSNFFNKHFQEEDLFDSIE